MYQIETVPLAVPPTVSLIILLTLSLLIALTVFAVKEKTLKSSSPYTAITVFLYLAFTGVILYAGGVSIEAWRGEMVSHNTNLIAWAGEQFNIVLSEDNVASVTGKACGYLTQDCSGSGVFETPKGDVVDWVIEDGYVQFVSVERAAS